jgi:non-homologous end joining protein Ku
MTLDDLHKKWDKAVLDEPYYDTDKRIVELVSDELRKYVLKCDSPNYVAEHPERDEIAQLVKDADYYLDDDTYMGDSAYALDMWLVKVAVLLPKLWD